MTDELYRTDEPGIGETADGTSNHQSPGPLFEAGYKNGYQIGFAEGRRDALICEQPTAWIGPNDQLMTHEVFSAWASRETEFLNGYRPLYERKD